MQNHEHMFLDLTRLEVLDVRIALLDVLHAMKSERNNPETTAERRQVLENSIKKWEKLRKKIIWQFDMQDH